MNNSLPGFREPVRSWVYAAIDQGWDMTVTRRGHILLKNPETGRSVGVQPKSQWQGRALNNCRAQMRRAGIKLPDSRN